MKKTLNEIKHPLPNERVARARMRKSKSNDKKSNDHQSEEETSTTKAWRHKCIEGVERRKVKSL